MSSGAESIALTAVDLSKNYGAFSALKDVNMVFRFGQCVAVMGENGAGKSTLMKSLSGVEDASSGVVYLGECESAANRGELEDAVSMVPQEIDLAEDRSVAQNIFMGIEPGSRLFPSPRKLVAETKELLNSIGSDLKPSTRVGDLDSANKQMVLIARALARRASIIVFDEPTANLSPIESASLFEVIERLKSDGKAILYVSHRIPEVFTLSDRIEVLRDGLHVDGWDTADTSPERVVNAMVGREVTLKRRAAGNKQANSHGEALEVEDLEGTSFGPVSFAVHPGQVLGLAGLPDSGRESLLQTIYGASNRKAGKVMVGGAENTATVRSSVKSGVAYLPGERRAAGIFPQLSVRQNIAALVVSTCTRFGLVNPKKMNDIANTYAKAVNVRAASLALPITSLSGGNQQKALISRMLASKPSVLLLDEPTRGVDVGAKAEIYALISDLTAEGMSVLLSSSDLPELLGQCDEIAVMFRGELVSVLDGGTATEDQIMAYATMGHSIKEEQ